MRVTLTHKRFVLEKIIKDPTLTAELLRDFDELEGLTNAQVVTIMNAHKKAVGATISLPVADGQIAASSMYYLNIN